MSSRQCFLSFTLLLQASGFLFAGWPLVAGGQPLAVAAAERNGAQVDFDIAPQELSDAVLVFAQQAKVQVFFDSGMLKGLDSRALRGQHSVTDGLARLLEGLPVRYRFSDSRTVVLERLDQTNGLLELGEIRVEANRDRGNEWIYSTPRSVSVITREQLDRHPPRHAADMLVETPGVYSAAGAQDPALSVNIRGMQDFGRVNTMIDGMRQNFNENGHQQRNGQLYVDSELISSVVIEKGPRSDVTGASAIAGSVNFGTLDYRDIILPGNDQGVRLRGTTGVGGHANGVNFIGSAAVAGRPGDNLELLGARSRRSFGEYAPGKRREDFGFLSASVQDGRPGITQVVDRIKFSDQLQDSELFKGRLSLTPEQSLQFTYLGTDLSYNNVSDRRVINPVDGSARDGKAAWAKYGDASARSQSFGLDYSYTPDSPWIDLKAKLYFVTTENQRDTVAGRPQVIDGVDMTATAWRLGQCRQSPLPDAWKAPCEAGLGNETKTRIDTYGFTLDNTAHFALAGVEGFSFNHGFEYFLDKGRSTSASDYQGERFSAGQNTLNPNGERSIASAFGSLTFETEHVTLSGGLRYDYYRLKGTTQVPVTDRAYLSRAQKVENYLKDMLRTNQVNCMSPLTPKRKRERACRDIPVYQAHIAAGAENYPFYDRASFAPTWAANPGLREYRVDDSQDKLLPTLSAAYRPSDWLELFANWGKSWRPPALTESLMQGAHPGDPFARMYPNPYAEPETSRSWELGLNIDTADLMLSGDRFQAKAAYYDTRIDNYLITSINNVLPGQPGGLGNTMFVNNQAAMNFRGIELELDYDARRWYTALNYTHVIGGENTLCQKTYPLGSGLQPDDIPREDGSYSPLHDKAVATGFSSYQAYLDAQQYCDGDVFGMNSARNLPMDRGSWVFGTRWLDESLELGARLNYSAAGGPEDWSYDLWPSYTTWDLFASYRVNRNLALRATLENLRDRSYVSGYSDIFNKSYGPGRTLMAGMELQF